MGWLRQVNRLARWVQLLLNLWGSWNILNFKFCWNILNFKREIKAWLWIIWIFRLSYQRSAKKKKKGSETDVLKSLGFELALGFSAVNILSMKFGLMTPSPGSVSFGFWHFCHFVSNAPKMWISRGCSQSLSRVLGRFWNIPEASLASVTFQGQRETEQWNPHWNYWSIHGVGLQTQIPKLPHVSKVFGDNW